MKNPSKIKYRGPRKPWAEYYYREVPDVRVPYQIANPLNEVWDDLCSRYSPSLPVRRVYIEPCGPKEADFVYPEPRAGCCHSKDHEIIITVRVKSLMDMVETLSHEWRHVCQHDLAKAGHLKGVSGEVLENDAIRFGKRYCQAWVANNLEKCAAGEVEAEMWLRHNPPELTHNLITRMAVRKGMMQQYKK